MSEHDADPTPEALSAAAKLWHAKIAITEPRTVHGRIADIACALDTFAQARVEAAVERERERCFKWAIGRRTRSQAAMAIREGGNPDGHPRDPSLCWRCGETLHPGHFCGKTSIRAGEAP